MPLDTLLCDLGNVLAPFDFGRCARAFAALCGRPAAEVAPLLRGPEYLELERGRITDCEFFVALGERLGTHLRYAEARAAWCDIFTVDPAMVRLVERLAGRYPVYLWSNSNLPHLEHLRPLLPVLSRLRGLHLSCELGAVKPEALFFERALARGGLDPSRCVFVDDLEANLAGAAALGITPVLHRSAAATGAALSRLGLRAGP